MSSRFSNIKSIIGNNKRLLASVTLLGVGVTIAYYIYGPKSKSEDILKNEETASSCKPSLPTADESEKKQILTADEDNIPPAYVAVADVGAGDSVAETGKPLEDNVSKPVDLTATGFSPVSGWQSTEKDIAGDISEIRVEKTEEMTVGGSSNLVQSDCQRPNTIARDVDEAMKLMVATSPDHNLVEVAVASTEVSEAANETVLPLSGTVSPVLSDNGFERVYLPKVNQENLATDNDNGENASMTSSGYEKPDQSSFE